MNYELSSMNYAVKFSCVSLVFLFTILILFFVFIPHGKSIIDHHVRKQDMVWNTVVQKLDRTPNTFTLRKEVSLIPKAQASADYANALSYIALDMDSGQVLFEKDSAKALPIASLTKIMSAVVALDLESAQNTVTIS